MKVRRFTQFNVWPVVQRELREGARRPVNHRLRCVGVGVGTVMLWFLVGTLLNKPSAQLGGWLLGGLHTMVLGLILLIVPALTADCIAREKREGTLGLLFLTPLSAGDIVAGKALAQALRALTLWLAVLPILAIPFMTGGITWYDALSALSLEFCAAVLCLAAGLLASTLARERNSAFLLAFLFGGIFLFLFSQLILLVIFGGWRGFAALKGVTWWDMATDGMRLITGLTAVRGAAGWNSIGTFSAVLIKIWTYFCCASLPVVLLVFYLVALFAARRIKRSWQDKIPSARRESFLRIYCAPLFRRRFWHAMQRTLDWNPIAWLQQYSWKARASKWGLCLLFLLIECAAHNQNFETGETALALALAGVSGFLEEKRSGALELLLITPISVNKLIFGRVWGLWKQFVPASLVLVGFYADRQWFMYKTDGGWYASVQMEFMLACGFLALPIFATYFALRVKNLIVAAVLTFIALCIPTAFAGEFMQMFTRSYQVEIWLMPPVVLCSFGGFTLLTCFLLRHSLSRRIYPF